MMKQWTRVFGKLLASALLATSALTVHSQTYVVGGATDALTPNSFGWAWNGSYLTDFRTALENPNNFGPTGVVNQSISTVNLSTIDATSLSGLDMFVATWIADGDLSATQIDAVKAFFLAGGDLFLLQDDSSHDVIGEALGLTTSGSSGAVSNGGAPLYNGPFGIATDVAQLYNVGQLDATAVAALGGTVAGTNADGQITSAYWARGAFAAGAGALFINADIDMIASTCAPAVCGASYSPLNSNGIFALNTFAFIQQGGTAPPIPEPSTYALMLAGLVSVFLMRRRAARRPD